MRAIFSWPHYAVIRGEAHGTKKIAASQKGVDAFRKQMHLASQAIRVVKMVRTTGLGEEPDSYAMADAAVSILEELLEYC